MKTSTLRATLALSITLLAGLAGTAHGQVLGKISASAATVKVGEPVQITATIDVVGGNYCGFVVDFGDGTLHDGVSDASNASPYPLNHTYAKPGNYRVTFGGRNVQNHPNCGGQEQAINVMVTGAEMPVAAAKPVKLTASNVCPKGWKVAAKSFNAKTGAYTCTAKANTAIPETKTACGDLTYFENVKKGQFGCRP